MQRSRMNPPRQKRYALPHPVPLIGRDPDLSALTDMLCSTKARLVTVAGPAGVGKTALATQAAQLAASCFQDGVLFIPLAQVSNPERVLSTIEAAIRDTDLVDLGNQPPLARISALARGKHLLLVLDNLEQIPGCGLELASILSETEGITMLATSRETLRVSGERAFDVAPLPLPPLGQIGRLSVADIIESPAVLLLIERAMAADPQSAWADPLRSLTPTAAAMTADVCRRLDGIPLAIELAAARLRTTDAGQIETMLAGILTEFSTAAPAGVYQQHVMRQAVTWSYDLLSPEEQRFFECLSVFAGGFQVEALHQVVPDLDENEVLVLIQSLVDKNLLSTISHPIHGIRIVMLESFRDFAIERLRHSHERDLISERHALWCLSLASAPLATARHQTLERELDNVRAAVEWAATTRSGDLLAQFCETLGEFMHVTGRLHESYSWLLLVHHGRYEATIAPHLQMSLAFRTGSTARQVGDLPTSAVAYERMRALADLLNDRGKALDAITGMGLTAEASGDEGLAIACFRESLNECRMMDAPRELASALVNLGDAEYRQGSFVDSYQHSSEAHLLAKEIDEPVLCTLAAANLAQLALVSGQIDQAWTTYNDALGRARSSEDGILVADTVSGMAGVAAGRGQYNLACSLLAASQALCKRLGGTILPHFGQAHAVRSRLTRILTPEEWTRWSAAGEAWELEEILGVIETLAPPSPTPGTLPPGRDPSSLTTVFGLSEREIDVLRRVAHGQSDREIGEDLFISHRTVMRHVSNIFRKLDVRTRLEATAAAIRMGLT
ncbi:MAG: LuxR C-terminal-related transcriptional regulator [Thermomicrobiales bacterium]